MRKGCPSHRWLPAVAAHPVLAARRLLQPFPQTAGNRAVLHEADFRVRWCGDRERAVRGQSPATTPAARACGAINDPGMIERRARLNEVANEPDARQRLGRSATDHSRPAAPTC